MEQPGDRQLRWRNSDSHANAQNTNADAADAANAANAQNTNANADVDASYPDTWSHQDQSV